MAAVNLFPVERLRTLVSEDVVDRIRRLLLVSELVVGIDADTEVDLADQIAAVIDDAVDAEALLANVIGAPAASLVEALDRGVYRLLARRLVRAFRRRWGKLDARQRSAILSELRDISSDLGSI